jgi:hypothetical protein
MSQLEFIIGGESVLVDDISNEFVNTNLNNMRFPPQDMYYVNLPSNKMTVPEIKQHIIQNLPELIVSKIDETLEVLKQNSLLMEEITEFNNNPYLVDLKNNFMLELCMNPTKEIIENYFGTKIDQSTEKSRFICNIINLYNKTIRDWKETYQQYKIISAVNPATPTFNITKCKEQISSLMTLLWKELK